MMVILPGTALTTANLTQLGLEIKPEKRLPHIG